MGSKNRISKEIVPILQSFITDDTVGYIEPFVGGANMIDKIKCENKIGYDIHYQLIELLKHVQICIDDLPDTISEEEYEMIKNNRNNYDDWYVGLVGFCATFGSKYFGGYARSMKSDGITPRDMPNERINNLKKTIS